MSGRHGYSFVRYLFFFSNVVFWILGCGSLGVGVWLYVSKNEYQTLTPASYSAMSAAGLLIAAGATIVVIGFVGCCGAWVQNRCLLLTYFVFVLLIFLIELSIGVLGVLYKEETYQSIRLHMRARLNVGGSAYLTDGRRHGVHLTWDELQRDFECCGVDNYTDWFRSKRFPRQNYVPDSCCDPKFYEAGTSANCGKVGRTDHWYKKGCYEAFSYWLLEHIHICAVIAFCLAVVQIFGLLSSALLFCQLRKGHHTWSAVDQLAD